MKILYEIKNLHKNYRGKSIIQDFNLIIHEGESIGFIGTSGVGKSTIARLICRLEKIDSGNLLYHGGNFRREVQIIFQDPFNSLNPRMRVRQLIEEPLKIHRVTNSVVDLLHQVKLSEDFLNRYPHELSGGQCQRVAIARTLALKPRLLICDEITSSLDALTQKQVLALLRENIKEQGCALLFISHNLKVVHHLCDRIIDLSAFQPLL